MLKILLLLLRVHLGLVLQDVLAFLAANVVLAAMALAVLIARDSGLEALAVFLEALALLAAAAFRVTQLVWVHFVVTVHFDGRMLAYFAL